MDEIMIDVNVKGIVTRKHNGQTQIVIQAHRKNGKLDYYKLPGGKIEEYKSMTEILRKSILEETGLYVTTIKNEKEEIVTKSEDSLFTIQCIKPYAVYQTLYGTEDSFGVYFVCNAEGDFIDNDENTDKAQWETMQKIQYYVDNKKFSDIDMAAILMFLSEYNY